MELLRSKHLERIRRNVTHLVLRGAKDVFLIVQQDGGKEDRG
jgi:hypothetical protein